MNDEWEELESAVGSFQLAARELSRNDAVEHLSGGRGRPPSSEPDLWRARVPARRKLQLARAGNYSPFGRPLPKPDSGRGSLHRGDNEENPTAWFRLRVMNEERRMKRGKRRGGRGWLSSVGSWPGQKVGLGWGNGSGFTGAGDLVPSDGTSPSARVKATVGGNGTSLSARVPSLSTLIPQRSCRSDLWLVTCDESTEMNSTTL